MKSAVGSEKNPQVAGSIEPALEVRRMGAYVVGAMPSIPDTFRYYPNPEQPHPSLFDLVDSLPSGSDIKDFTHRYGQHLSAADLELVGKMAEAVEGGEFPDTPFDTDTSLSGLGVYTYTSNRTNSEEHGDFNLRPSDVDGARNRLLYLERIGVAPDQVLSPILGSSGDVVTITSGSELVYSAETARLTPAENDGHADGWLVTEPALARTLAQIGYVADCPMITVAYAPPDESGHHAVKALGMFHAGWQNVANGIAENMAAAIEAAGIDKQYLFASVGVGAGDDYKKSEAHIRAQVAIKGGDASRVLKHAHAIENEPGIVELDEIQVARTITEGVIGVPALNIAVDNRSTLSNPSLHSYARDKGTNPSRPEAGRSGVITVPPECSIHEREALFGNVARSIPGILENTADTDGQIRYRVR